MIRALLGLAAIAILGVVAAPSCSADPVTDLFSMLPAGYDNGSCEPGTTKLSAAGALAATTCDQNSLPGGPKHARYVLFSDPAFAGKFLRGYITDPSVWSEATCPGAASTAPLPIQNSDGKTVGSVGCGYANDSDPAIIWTHGTLYGQAHGSDHQSLINWLNSSGALG